LTSEEVSKDTVHATFSFSRPSLEIAMGRVPGIEIVRRAYKIWEDSGKPEGKDEEFYLRAERELEEELSQRESKTPDTP
jgi:hypothetical protein